MNREKKTVLMTVPHQNHSNKRNQRCRNNLEDIPPSQTQGAREMQLPKARLVRWTRLKRSQLVEQSVCRLGGEVCSFDEITVFYGLAVVVYHGEVWMLEIDHDTLFSSPISSNQQEDSTLEPCVDKCRADRKADTENE